ncbi:MAG: hypothetical protein A2504_16010 [Bdellovibrionales bacterium RIFOXYD12_FULL_39_22]|nr:MAG: hypothetical protein A2385_07920 [Bdellovibrionales bacterium RIFOXYB1_FULL_39_21]OFZ43014.1 MAG: hypothetical protein A2485_11305 [Bdellovibrionales bacterium RIFOXYC12_FULL_39_17]OFZ50900.1 MAG: hypothetical protein A2404_06835 [Bdellovibrionales bacterium RIFOXYC1_FULL_39_130]OFZ78123.1 MAG: hypothetical protein A2560_02005 [Bdellovibrionales bacterium RIFOXYD1_FULL_39_84]OFZ93991.1 MAG: hypothetical protein A2504_16010 [Bdellovibrionales bacterium RIFOXYD12_FULL_39_22]HLE10441.1 SO
MEFLYAFIKYLVITAPFLLFGFGIAGIINAVVSMEYIKKNLGGSGVWPIIKAAIWGVPLPLCSCSVIPTAVTLKKSGASNATTSAFLISTPESGVDSIAITYSLMDLPMAIIRPVSAFVTAFIAGILQNIFNRTNDNAETEKPEKESCGSSCCCSEKKTPPPSTSIFEKIKSVFTFAYGTLIDDMAGWLLFGLVVGAAIDYLIPVHIIENFNGIGGKFAMLLVGIPLYICASSSTPIAAALMLKGMSPGTALIFLLAGPATNISSLIVMQKYIGRKGVIINVATIAIVSLIISIIVDFLYEFFTWPTTYNIAAHEHMGHGEFSYGEIAMATILFLLLLKGIYMANFKGGEGKK